MELAALCRFGFLTLPHYSMIACTNAIEVLRMANRVAGHAHYQWQVVTPDGTPATASNGMTMQPTVSLGAMARPDLLLACGGVDVREAVSRPVITGLRRMARDGVPLGALCTGAFALAEAGLLRDRRCAIHWENLAAIEEEFPDIDFVGDVYAIDCDRVTCTGGIAPLSLMLAMVKARLGAALADAVAAQFMIGRVLPGATRQRALPAPLENGRLGAAVRMMEASIAHPLPAATVARSVGVTPRQLERLFRRYLGQTPAGYATGLRLDRARTLLHESALPITAIASACGYATPSRFSAAYRARFDRTPTAERGLDLTVRRTPDARQPIPA